MPESWERYLPVFSPKLSLLFYIVSILDTRVNFLRSRLLLCHLLIQRRGFLLRYKTRMLIERSPWINCYSKVRLKLLSPTVGLQKCIFNLQGSVIRIAKLFLGQEGISRKERESSLCVQYDWFYHFPLLFLAVLFILLMKLFWFISLNIFLFIFGSGVLLSKSISNQLKTFNHKLVNVSCVILFPNYLIFFKCDEINFLICFHTKRHAYMFFFFVHFHAKSILPLQQYFILTFLCKLNHTASYRSLQFYRALFISY